MEQFIGVIGIVVMLGLAFAFSKNRKNINLRIVGSALALQFFIALLVFKTNFGQAALHGATTGIEHILEYSNAGIAFIFGDFVTQNVPLNFAVRVLPVIIFVGALMSVLFHLGIMQIIMRGLEFVLRRVIGISGVEALSASMNIFVGQDSAPFAVRPYLKTASSSTLFLIMVTGMATIAGSILAGLIGMGVNAQNLIVASFMGAPGGILMAKMMVPDDKAPISDDTKEPVSTPQKAVKIENTKHSNVIEAAAVGAAEGVQLAIIIGATLIAYISLIAMLNGIVGGIGGIFGMEDLRLQTIVGTIFSPLMFLIGIPWQDAVTAGSLFGDKVIVNEFVAYSSFVSLGDGAMSDRANDIITIALCGFANFSSIAIVIGGVGTLVPERRAELSSFGLRAVFAASLANLISAAMVGLLI